MTDTQTSFGPNGVREVRAVFGPAEDASGNKTPVRAIVVVVEDDAELTIEATGVMDVAPTGGLDMTREAIEVNTFDRPGFVEHVAGRLSGLLTLSTRITGPDPDGVRITRRTRDKQAVPIEDLLPGVPTAEAVATLVQDRDFVHRRVQAVEAELGRRMQLAEQADQRHQAERAAWAAELRDALTERDAWRRKAKTRKRKLADLREQLAEVDRAIDDGHNLNARDVHDVGE